MSPFGALKIVPVQGFPDNPKKNAGGDIVLCLSQLNLSARAYHRILNWMDYPSFAP
ncbi:MAG: hypothetical protein IH589_20610 [Anaerolineales bacterium]|nr:hypothetical protein [Anaerolineales bacterium]